MPSKIFRPLYREIIRDALVSAWKEKRLWLIALFAALLQTGGIYDTIIIKVRSLAHQSDSIASNWHATSTALSNLLRNVSLFQKINLVEALVLSIILALGFISFAIIAQGTLATAIHSRSRLNQLTLRESISHAAHRFIPLVVLNILSTGLIYIVTFLTAIPLAQSIASPNAHNVLAYLVMYCVLLIAIVVFVSLHMLTLNGLMTDDLTLHEAIRHAFEVFGRAWVLVIETAVALMIIGAALFIIAVGIGFIATLFLYHVQLAATILVWPRTYYAMAILIRVIYLILFALAGVYAVTFQYIAWNRLYQRLAEGTAHAKIHRFFHWVTNLVTPEKK